MVTEVYTAGDDEPSPCQEQRGIVIGRHFFFKKRDNRLEDY